MIDEKVDSDTVFYSDKREEEFCQRWDKEDSKTRDLLKDFWMCFTRGCLGDFDVLVPRLIETSSFLNMDSYVMLEKVRAYLDERISTALQNFCNYLKQRFGEISELSEANTDTVADRFFTDERISDVKPETEAVMTNLEMYNHFKRECGEPVIDNSEENLSRWKRVQDLFARFSKEEREDITYLNKNPVGMVTLLQKGLVVL
jgi:hypothetical protein